MENREENKSTLEMIRKQLEEVQCVKNENSISLYECVNIYRNLPSEEALEHEIEEIFSQKISKDTHLVSSYLDVKEDRFYLKIVVLSGKHYEFCFQKQEGLHLTYATPGTMSDSLVRIFLTEGYEWVRKEWERQIYENSPSSECLSFPVNDFSVQIADGKKKVSIFYKQNLSFQNPNIERGSFGIECSFREGITYRLKTSHPDIYVLLDGNEEKLFQKITIPLSFLPSYIRDRAEEKEKAKPIIGMIEKKKRRGTLLSFLKGKV